MKTHRNITMAVSLATFAFAAAPLTSVRGDEDKTRDKRHGTTETSGQYRSGTDMKAHAAVQVASDRVSERGLDKFLGKEIRGVNGEQVGTVEDFILDAKSGKVAFAVVASGGVAGIGETLRVVPYRAIKLAANDEGFTTPVEQSQWNKMPALDKGDFEEGRINLTAEQQRELSANYGASDADVTAGVESTTETVRETSRQGDFAGRMVRATDLQGKTVRANNQELGEIEDIIIDFQRGTASALIDAESEFTGSDRDFLVSLQKLQIRGRDQEMITTELSRADFERAEPSQESVAASISERDERRATVTSDAGQTRTTTTDVDVQQRQDRVSGTSATASGSVSVDRDEQLTPTGRTETRAANNAKLDPALESAARSVQQLWEAHPELAKLNLEASAENGRLILQGSVPNQDAWERAKDAAEGVVRGIDIENRITIRD